MSTVPMAQRDERTVAAENAGYRWGYLFLAFGLLGLVAFRSFTYGQSSWDLLGLVISSGILITAYQAAFGVLSRRWVVACLLSIAGAVVLAALMAWLL